MILLIYFRNSLEIQGRRFIDIGHLFKSIQRIRHEPFDCTFADLDLVKEIRKGYFSKFIFKCKICCKMEVISSEPEEKSSALKINTAIVSSVVNTGQGYAQLEQFSAILNMPCMTNSTYQKEHEIISGYIETTMWQSLEMAGKEEAKMAIERGDVDKNGVPLITVVADGAWSKRSYKSNYNAISGVVSFYHLNNNIISIC